MVRVLMDGRRNPHGSSSAHYGQLCKALLNLQDAADKIFDTITDRVGAEHQRLKGLSSRIQTAKQQGSSAVIQMELEKLRSDHRRSLHLIQQWQQVYQDLHSFCVNELISGSKVADNDAEIDKPNERGKIMEESRMWEGNDVELVGGLLAKDFPCFKQHIENSLAVSRDQFEHIHS